MTVPNSTQQEWHEDAVRYLTEDPSAVYGAAIRAAKCKADLVAAIEPWKRLAPDAYKEAWDCNWKDMAWALKHARSEGDGEKVNQIAGNVLMPAVMLQVSMVAIQFKAPWGCAFIRMREMEQIKLTDNGWAVAHG